MNAVPTMIEEKIQKKAINVNIVCRKENKND